MLLVRKKKKTTMQVGNSKWGVCRCVKDEKDREKKEGESDGLGSRTEKEWVLRTSVADADAFL